MAEIVTHLEHQCIWANLKLKLSLSQKGGFGRQKLSPNLKRQCIWADLNLKLSLSQKVGCMAEVVYGTSVHLGRVARRDWWTFCHLGSKVVGTLSCNPTQDT